MPRICAAFFFTSSTDFATFTPPPLPRPPAWICALTTQTLPPSFLAASTASSTENAGKPRGVGTPYSGLQVVIVVLDVAEMRLDVPQPVGAPVALEAHAPRVRQLALDVLDRQWHGGGF